MAVANLTFSTTESNSGLSTKLYQSDVTFFQAVASPLDDYYNSYVITITAGTGAGQYRTITDYTGSTGVATVATWGTNPDSTSAFSINVNGVPVTGTATAGAATTITLGGTNIHYLDRYSQNVERVFVASDSPATIASALNDATFSAQTLNDGSVLYLTDKRVIEIITGSPNSNNLSSPLTGTATAGGATTITLVVGASTTDSFYNGYEIVLTGGTGVGQKRFITGYVGATLVATVGVAWDTNPDSTTTYSITLAGSVIIYDRGAQDYSFYYSNNARGYVSSLFTGGYMVPTVYCTSGANTTYETIYLSKGGIVKAVDHTTYRTLTYCVTGTASKTIDTTTALSAY